MSRDTLDEAEVVAELEGMRAGRTSEENRASIDRLKKPTNNYSPRGKKRAYRSLSFQHHEIEAHGLTLLELVTF